MLRLVTITVGMLAAGCTFYTSCPHSTATGAKCNSPASSSQAGAGPVGGGGGNSEGSLGGSAPTEPWRDATGSLVGIQTDFGNVCYVSAKPNEDMLIAGLSTVGLWASGDGAQTWEAIGTAEGSAELANRTNTIIYDPDDSNVFWEAGTYGPGVFKTTDGGHQFTQLGTIGHIEHLAIDLSDPDRQTLLAAGHEQGHVLWLSQNAGSTWTDIGARLPVGASVCSYPMILDSQTFLLTCSGFNAPESGYGIFRSTDAGQNWTQVSTQPASLPALYASDGAIYWPTEGGNALLKSTDQGLNWAQTFGGGARSYGLELPGGSIVFATEQYLILSNDHGATWRPVSSRLPFVPTALAYSPFQKAFFISTVTTQDVVPPEVIQRFDFDDSASP